MTLLFRTLITTLFAAALTHAAMPVAAPQKLPIPAGTEKPALSRTVTPKMTLFLTIEELQALDHGTSMTWYVRTVNRGPRIDKNRLEIRAYQMMGTHTLGEAGLPITTIDTIDEGGQRTFTRQNWPRLREAAQLKVVITDKQTHRSVSKVINLPGSANPAVSAAMKAAATPNSNAFTQINSMDHEQFTNPEQELTVLEAEYRGRGAYGLKIRNVGNRGILPNQLTIRPFYHVMNRPAVVGTTASNPSGILANGWKWVANDGGGIYVSGMAECAMLQKVVVEIKNPLTGQMLEKIIPVERPKGEIIDTDMYMSTVTYTIKNTGSYRSKFLVRMMHFELTKGKYDHLDTLYDLFHTSITLDAGQTGTVSIDRALANAELKAKRPSLKNTFYGADNYMVELYTSNDANYCPSTNPIVLDQAHLRRHGGVAAGEEILISE